MKYNNQGGLWRNEERTSDVRSSNKQPNAVGNAVIDGVEYFVSAWRNGDATPENRKPMMTLSFDRKVVKKAEAQTPDNVSDFDDGFTF